MKVGDLVKCRCPTPDRVGKVFLVIAIGEYNWIKLLGEGTDGWYRISDWWVLNESR